MTDDVRGESVPNKPLPKWAAPEQTESALKNLAWMNKLRDDAEHFLRARVSGKTTLEDLDRMTQIVTGLIEENAMKHHGGLRS